MFDFFNVEKMCKRTTDKVFNKLKIDQDPIISNRFKKILRWVGERLPVILHRVLMAFVTFWFFNYILTKFGIGKIVIIGLMIITYNMLEINKSLKKLTE